MVLLGDPGVGKTSLASLFAGKQERELQEQLGGREPGAGLECGRRGSPVIGAGGCPDQMCNSHTAQPRGASFSQTVK